MPTAESILRYTWFVIYYINFLSCKQYKIFVRIFFPWGNWRGQSCVENFYIPFEANKTEKFVTVRPSFISLITNIIARYVAYIVPSFNPIHQN
jgi:hypothetical protein